MPCRAALHAQGHAKEHVAVDAGWGPFPREEDPSLLAQRGAVQGKVPLWEKYGKQVCAMIRTEAVSGRERL